MDITQDLKKWLDGFAGALGFVHEYRKFGSILRLSVETNDGEYLISFAGCVKMSFQSGMRRYFSEVIVKDEDQCLRVVDSEAGLDVTFEQCFLVSSDEYLSDES